MVRRIAAGRERPLRRGAGVEAVRRVGVDGKFTGLAGRLARGPPRFDRLLRDALIRAAIESEARAFHIGGEPSGFFGVSSLGLRSDPYHATAAFFRRRSELT